MVVIKREKSIGGVVVDIYKSSRYDDLTLQFRAKHNCRKCHGRGKHYFDHPGKGLKWVETCSCVHRREHQKTVR